MKNRRNIIVAFLLCACMIVGIGYAAFSDNMDITGTASLNANDIIDGNIFFESATAEQGSGNTATVNQNNQDKASFTITNLRTENESTYFTFVVKNTNSSAHYIALRTVAGTVGATNYSITAKMVNDENDSREITNTSEKTLTADDYIKINADQTVTITVTVAMTSTPEGQEVNAHFLINLAVKDAASIASN